MAFEITAAQIVALFMEAIFYGIYLVTFGSCMRVLLWKDGWFKRLAAINKTMVTTALLMMVFATLDVGLGLRHNLDAFVYTNGGRTPAAEFAQISYWVNVMKFASYAAQTFIGDGILIYRCYVVYDRNPFVISFPVLTWLGTTACAVVATVTEASIGTGVLNQFQLKPFITSMLTLTLATNVITTSLLIHRIWSIQSRTSRRTTRDNPYSRLVTMLVECGMIYTSSILILFGCYLASNNAQLGVSDSVVQIIGITFNLLILNVDRGTVTQPIDVSSSFINAMQSQIGDPRSAVPLHQLNIKTVTTISRDFPAPINDRDLEKDYVKFDKQ